jgi:hypothetical protein
MYWQFGHQIISLNTMQPTWKRKIMVNPFEEHTRANMEFKKLTLPILAQRHYMFWILYVATLNWSCRKFFLKEENTKQTLTMNLSPLKICVRWLDTNISTFLWENVVSFLGWYRGVKKVFISTCHNFPSEFQDSFHFPLLSFITSSP